MLVGIHLGIRISCDYAKYLLLIVITSLITPSVRFPRIPGHDWNRDTSLRVSHTFIIIGRYCMPDISLRLASRVNDTIIGQNKRITRACVRACACARVRACCTPVFQCLSRQVASQNECAVGDLFVWGSRFLKEYFRRSLHNQTITITNPYLN